MSLKLENKSKIFEMWTIMFINGVTVADKLLARHQKTVAIYGMGELGQLLGKELKKSGIIVKYVFDKKPVFSEYPLKKTSDPCEPVDLIIITALSDFEEIKEELSQYYPYEATSLLELLSWD